MAWELERDGFEIVRDAISEEILDEIGWEIGRMRLQDHAHACARDVFR